MTDDMTTTFKPGDIVRFNDEYWPVIATLSCSDTWAHRDRTYTVDRVREFHDACDIRTIGHHQHIALIEDPNQETNGYPNWSGAFFELAQENTP